VSCLAFVRAKKEEKKLPISKTLKSRKRHKEKQCDRLVHGQAKKVGSSGAKDL